MSAARQAWENELRFKGTMTVGKAPTVEDIRAHLHKNCRCYGCRANEAYLERLTKRNGKAQ